MQDTCLEIVRTGDKDLFIATLFAPVVAQPHLFALHAFAVEVARVPLVVSEPQLGEIRLQWWEDTLDAIEQGEPQVHPVAQSLAETVVVHRLPLAPLRDLVEAHRLDLYAGPFPTVTALETYCGQTRSALFQLSCLILDPKTVAQAAEASGLSGVAFGIARGLHSSLTDKFSGEQITALAERRLAEARTAIAKLPRQLLPTFLPVALTELYLSASSRGKSVPQWKRQWRLWRAARSGKF
jgi:15-cis-phytoene synthase